MRPGLRAVGAVFVVGARGFLGAAPPGQSAVAARFTIVAAQTSANAEQNFNGTSKGQMVITVPLGAMVQITFKNQGTLPHSLQIIPPTNPLPATALSAPAFPGAQIKNPQAGITKGQTATVQFTATKAGKYLMICGFPGHVLLGMYANFIVAESPAAKPAMKINK
jgi:sulfocyanin